MRGPGWGRVRIFLLSGCLAAVAPIACAAQNSAQQELPDSPDTVIGQKAVEARLFGEQTPSSSSASSTPQAPQAATQPASQASPQQVLQSAPQSQAQSGSSQRPAGTAVAETPPTTGFAASNPAGAAIAPAKQRRVRTLLISVGAILGAGVAVGVVAGLSAASPSKPPGSR